MWNRYCPSSHPTALLIRQARNSFWVGSSASSDSTKRHSSFPAPDLVKHMVRWAANTQLAFAEKSKIFKLLYMDNSPPKERKTDKSGSHKLACVSLQQYHEHFYWLLRQKTEGRYSFPESLVAETPDFQPVCSSALYPQVSVKDQHFWCLGGRKPLSWLQA